MSATYDPQPGDHAAIITRRYGDVVTRMPTIIERVTKTLVITSTGERFNRAADNKGYIRSSSKADNTSRRVTLVAAGSENDLAAVTELAPRSALELAVRAADANSTVADVDAAIAALRTLRAIRAASGS